MPGVKRKTLIQIILLKLKYAMSSTVATAVDYVLYLVLVAQYLPPVESNIISSGVGMIINFTLQKRFIFKLNRKVGHTFLLTVLVSVGGIAISTLLIHLLNKIEFFANYQFITKAIVIGIIFNYNFYLKKYAFEKKFT